MVSSPGSGVFRVGSSGSSALVMGSPSLNTRLTVGSTEDLDFTILANTNSAGDADSDST